MKGYANPYSQEPQTPSRNLAVEDDAMNQDATFPSCRAQSVSHTTTSAISQTQIFNTAMAQSATFWSASQLTGPSTAWYHAGRAEFITRNTIHTRVRYPAAINTVHHPAIAAQRLLRLGRAVERRRSSQSPLISHVKLRGTTSR